MSRSVLPQATEIEAVRAYVPASESIGRLGAFEAKVEAEAEAQAKAAAAAEAEAEAVAEEKAVAAEAAAAEAAAVGAEVAAAALTEAIEKVGYGLKVGVVRQQRLEAAKELDELLCGVCLGLLCRPHVLPCGHTFCGQWCVLALHLS
jgi:hypothetical protein